MNKEFLLKQVKDDYDKIVYSVEAACKFYKKLRPLLPIGWKVSARPDPVVFSITIAKGFECKSSEKIPIEEFRLVCKLVETIIKQPLRRGCEINEETEEFSYIDAYTNFLYDNAGLFVRIIIYNPGHKCEVTWKKETIIKAIVDDVCLGLAGEMS